MTSVLESPRTMRTPELPATMKAVVCYNPGDYRLEEVPVPVPGSDEVLTKVEACGICMGDVKTFHGAPSFWGDATQPRYVKPPMIPGHEFIGRVVTADPGGVAGGSGARRRHAPGLGPAHAGRHRGPRRGAHGR